MLNWFRKLPLSISIPLFVGGVYLFLHLPFILNIYNMTDPHYSFVSLFYLMLDGVFINTIGILSEYIFKKIWGEYSINTYANNMLFFLLSTVFLMLVFFFLGIALERSKKKTAIIVEDNS